MSDCRERDFVQAAFRDGRFFLLQEESGSTVFLDVQFHSPAKMFLCSMPTVSHSSSPPPCFSLSLPAPASSTSSSAPSPEAAAKVFNPRSALSSVDSSTSSPLPSESPPSSPPPP